MVIQITCPEGKAGTAPACAPSVPVFWSLNSMTSFTVLIVEFDVRERYSFMPLNASTLTTENSERDSAPRFLACNQYVRTRLANYLPVPATI